MQPPNIGIVLSGGGARGAYEAGVLAGIDQVVGPGDGKRALFQVVAGTSVGAINGAFMVANAHRRGHGVDELLNLWTSLVLREHLQVNLMGLLGARTPLSFLRRPKGQVDEHFGRSVLNPAALEALVTSSVDWGQLNANVASGLVHAFVVAALHVGSGATTMFANLAPGAEFHPSPSARRVVKRGETTAEHILASAAIPGLFPARRVGQTYFVDGSLRFNTPIASAIRAGADKLVVVTLRHERSEPPDVDAPGYAAAQYPNATFLLGKLLNALLLDPVSYDLSVLQRFNAVLEVVDEVMTPEEHARMDAVLLKTRGAPYRQVETLAFTPSRNIGLLAGEHLREYEGTRGMGRFYDWLFARAADVDATWEADLLSYLMFDGGWARRLIALGRADALKQADTIRAFFAGEPSQAASR